MRRPIALILLLLTVGYQTEPVFGEARDADVHHEEVAQAWRHAHDPHGSHAHDEPTDSAARDRGEQHENSGSLDHCTHLHGFALVHPVEVSFTFVECSYVLGGTPMPRDARFEALTPPPRS